MKKTYRAIGLSVLAMLLAAVMLFQLVSCAIPSEDAWGSSAEESSGTHGDPTAESAPQTESPTGTQPAETGSDESIPEESTGEEPPLEEVEPVDVQVKPAQRQPLIGVEAQKPALIPAEALTGYGVTVKADRDEGLASYASGHLSVVYDTNADKQGVTDTVTVNDVISLERGYYTQTGEDGLALGAIYAEFYEVEVDYDAVGRIAALYYYDRYYTYHYDLAARLSEIRCNGAPYQSFVYNANGNLVSETHVRPEGTVTRSYAYTEAGALYSVDGVAVGSAVLPAGLSTVYGYTFADTALLTEKTVGGETTAYKYVGDKVVELTRGGQTVSYVLDKDLNYVGLLFGATKYYFSVDPFGNVMGLADCDGNFVVEYQCDAWGTVTGITGSLAATLGRLNEIVNLNGLYDHTLGCYFFGADVYLPAYGATVREDRILPAREIYAWEQSNYFARSAVSTFSMIHDMVVKVAVDNLRSEGVDVVSGLYVNDAAGDSRRLADIYTLPYAVTPFSTMNLLNGNQVYEVIYHAPESQSFRDIALAKLHKITDPNGAWAVSYYADYHPSAGTMSFHGQFVYLEYLIDYLCTGNGVVEYQVKKNTLSNYDQTVNIYDYDREKYICYVNNTFDLEFLEGVTIIPGINQEQYEAIDGYLSEYLQSVAGNICDQMLIYDDPDYYDLETMNVTEDYWAQMNLTDTTTYLEIGEDGSVNVSVMPVWETDGFQTKLAIGAGVILVTAIVATIAIAIPGANCVVVSICVGAAKGAVTGALSGFAMGLVTPVINAGIERIATGEWPKMSAQEFFDQSLSAAADGFLSGAVLGAILGGIGGALSPKACFAAGTPVLSANGAVAIEEIAVGDRVWAYDYQTGTKTLKRVLSTVERETDRVIRLTVDGETVVTTPEHPFYVLGHEGYGDGYVAARELRVGDRLLCADGSSATVTATETETLDEPIKVYNLTVEDYHSYYVGDGEVLVHNSACAGSKVKYNVKNDNYVKKRGWSYDQIDDAINRGVKGTSTNMATGNPCSVYLSENGSYVIVDDVTNELVQLSKFGDPTWIPDPRIIWK